MCLCLFRIQAFHFFIGMFMANHALSKLSMIICQPLSFIDSQEAGNPPDDKCKW